VRSELDFSTIGSMLLLFFKDSFTNVTWRHSVEAHGIFWNPITHITSTAPTFKLGS
jgi:hypothetical protein